MLKQSNSAIDDQQWSLLTNPWIPATLTDGTNKQVSVLQALLEAQNISAITCDLPQEQFPIYRLLLSYLYRAYSEALGSQKLDVAALEKQWARIWSKGEFDEGVIRAYAKMTEDSWYLLDPDRPFYQIPGLEYATDKDYDPIGSALPDMPSKHEKFLFSMCAENSVRSISLDSAARLLVYLQGYDISGIHTPAKGSMTARSGKEYAPHAMMGIGLLGALGGVYAQGSNLFKTLMLNWVLAHDNKPLLVGAADADYAEDLAPWDPDYRIPSPLMDTDHQVTGVVGELTWQSRRILLIPTDDRSAVKGIRICFGDIPQVLNSDDLEMMTIWRDSSVQAKRNHFQRAVMPDQHDPTEYEWQGLASLLTQRSVGSGKKNGVTVQVPAPGVVDWIGQIREDAESGDITLGDQKLPAIVTFHAEGIQYGAQSAVISSGINDALELDSSLFGKDGANKKYISSVIGLVDKSEQSVYALTCFVRDLQIVAGSKNSDNKKEVVKETAYHELDQIFRRHLRSMPSPSESTAFLQEWRDEIHRLILFLAEEYRRQIKAPVFATRVEKIGHSGDGTAMTSSRADFYLRHSLNEALGRLPLPQEISTAGKGNDTKLESEGTV